MSKQNDILVSVLMTVYNTEKYLAEAIDSILKQTYTNFEFIIIDDGSTDHSVEILDTYSDPRLRIFKCPENKGLIFQSNKGLSLAKGKYIARMDSDDVVPPEKLALQVAFMEKHPEIGVCGTFLEYFNGTKSFGKSVLPVSHDAIGGLSIFFSSLIHGTAMIRKSVLDKFSISYPLDVKAGGDYAFISSIYEKTRAANIPKVLLKYRIHNTSVTRTHNQIQTGVGVKIKSRFLSNFLNSYNASDREELIQKHLTLLSIKISNTKEFTDIMKWLVFLDKHNAKEKKHDPFEFRIGMGHFLYRKLVANQACSFAILNILILKYFTFFSAWSMRFKVAFLWRCVNNLLHSKNKVAPSG
jgi:glycosyltransferase involved in cell wall biosynthesis